MMDYVKRLEDLKFNKKNGDLYEERIIKSRCVDVLVECHIEGRLSYSKLVKSVDFLSINKETVYKDYIR
jgi:hypothetical protein